MSKSDSDEEQQQSTQTSLETSLSVLGENGTNFLARLEGVHPIPSKLTPEEHSALEQINNLAALVPSDPYSAIVLRAGVLYVAQNQATARDETEEALIARLRGSAEYRALSIGSDLDIRVRRFDRNIGDHPDTVAIAFSLESSPRPLESEASFLGLAASNSQRPASCSSCGAVIKALNDNDHTFKVESYTPTNFPSNSNYRIPQVISRDPQLFDSYLDHISASIRILEQKIAPKNVEDLYVQYATRDEKRLLMRDESMTQEERTRQFDALDSEAREQYRSGDGIDTFQEQLGRFRKQVSEAKTEIIHSYSPARFQRAAVEKNRLEEEKVKVEERLSRLSKSRAIPSLDVVRESHRASLENKKTLEREIAGMKGAENNDQRILSQVEVARNSVDDARRRLESAQTPVDQPTFTKEQKKPERDEIERRYQRQVKAKAEAKRVATADLQKANDALTILEADPKYLLAQERARQTQEKLKAKAEELKRVEQRITLLRHAEESLLQLERIEQAIEARNRFLSFRGGSEVMRGEREQSHLNMRRTLSAIEDDENDIRAVSGHKGAVKQPARVAPSAGWYDDEAMMDILSRSRSATLITGEYDEAARAGVREPVHTTRQLQAALHGIPEEDGNYVIPMRVNVATRNFNEHEEGRNNHWVGVHIRRELGTITEANYVDPTGRPVNEEV